MNRILGVLAVGGLAALGSAAATSAGAMPLVSLENSAAGLGAVSEVRHRGYRHRHHAYGHYPRQRITVYPGGYGYGPYAGYYPPARGFEDYSSVRQGNIPSCAVDLGYGRYESCDK